MLLHWKVSSQLCTKSRRTRRLNQPCGDAVKPSQASSPAEFMDIVPVQILLLAMVRTGCIGERCVSQCSVYLVHGELSTSSCWTALRIITFALRPVSITLCPEKLHHPSFSVQKCRCFSQLQCFAAFKASIHPLIHLLYHSVTRLAKLTERTCLFVSNVFSVAGQDVRRCSQWEAGRSCDSETESGRQVALLSRNCWSLFSPVPVL